MVDVWVPFLAVNTNYGLDQETYSLTMYSVLCKYVVRSSESEVYCSIRFPNTIG